MPDIVGRLARIKALRLLAGAPFFEANRRLWPLLPPRMRESGLFSRYGGFLQRLARLRQDRTQSSWTCFLRNRAEIAYIAAHGRAVTKGGRLSVAIFGCSTGAEAYSAAFALRHCLDRIEVRIHASDIAPANIAAAHAGVFDAGGPETAGLAADEMAALFEASGDGRLAIRERWRRPIAWTVVDASEDGLGARVGQFDLVLANKFLCHMPPEMARACLRNIVSTVRPGGVLIVTGVDLDVRSAVARELALIPDTGSLAALHEGDRTLRQAWPFEYWALEPLNLKRADFAFRYSAAFNKSGANPFRRASAPDGIEADEKGQATA